MKSLEYPGRFRKKFKSMTTQYPGAQRKLIHKNFLNQKSPGTVPVKEQKATEEPDMALKLWSKQVTRRCISNTVILENTTDDIDVGGGDGGPKGG